jgi:hypothetical protein
LSKRASKSIPSKGRVVKGPCSADNINSLLTYGCVETMLYSQSFVGV